MTDGILGVQTRGDDVIPPQLAVAQRATGASTVIVSIGANDLNWAVLTGLCARSPVCDDKASTAYFTEQLAAFTQNYLDLLQQLSDLPHHPDVIVNDYYEPFGPDTGCLKKDGITPAKAQVLRSRLADLNTVLENGAEAFHFTSVRPRFDGHRLCSKQPFVQNSADKAPLHPTAAGELAIALADQQALSQLQQPGYAEPSPSADPPRLRRDRADGPRPDHRTEQSTQRRAAADRARNPCLPASLISAPSRPPTASATTRPISRRPAPRRGRQAAVEPGRPHTVVFCSDVISTLDPEGTLPHPQAPSKPAHRPSRSAKASLCYVLRKALHDSPRMCPAICRFAGWPSPPGLGVRCCSSRSPSR